MRAAAAGAAAVLLAAHVGSPDVFFAGRAGAYDVHVVVRPPQVVPGVATVSVRTAVDVRSVSIRPVFWRAGSRGAPAADRMRRAEGDARTFEGSLWLMQYGAYSVDVIVDGSRGRANVLVPVASVATGRLPLDPTLGALLTILGVVLVAGLVNIVYKGAGESLSETTVIDPARKRRAQRAAAIAVPILAVAFFGGARWWNAVDRGYERTIYRPAPLAITRSGNQLRIDVPAFFRPGSRASAIVPDHGKLMHLFLIRANDGVAFAHLHPLPVDTAPIPSFVTTLPPLPAGTYRVYADVVHDTGFERTLVGSLQVGDSAVPAAFKASDADDAWFAGEASRNGAARLADGSTMTLAISPNGVIPAGREESIRVTVRDPRGSPAALEPYLGMAAHAVVTRVDGAVYVHLHPMGTVTSAARQVFAAIDRGDTSSLGRVRLVSDSASMPMFSGTDDAITFPYAFPRSGSYRLFVQVRRNGRILTGAFAVTVAEAVDSR